MIFILVFVLVNIITGYLFGSLSWSIIIGKIFYKKDPRNHESMNAGATNSFRIYGKISALSVLILDVLKAIVPTIIIWLVIKNYWINEVIQYSIPEFNLMSIIYLCPLFSIIGHCYPIFFKFKGGKGAATFGGFLWIISPWIAILSFIVFISIIKIKKMVSLSVLITSVFSLILVFIPGINFLYLIKPNMNIFNILSISDIYSVLFTFFILTISTIIIFLQHRTNIRRIINHEERKIFLKNKKNIFKI